MYNEDTDVLFPPRVIPHLRSLRGEEWQALADQASTGEDISLERLSFVLLMVRLGGCSSCQADSFRAMRGCTQCAIQTIKRYRGSDEDLLKGYQEAKEDVDQYMHKKEAVR
jgi:hypothetical protein